MNRQLSKDTEIMTATIVASGLDMDFAQEIVALVAKYDGEVPEAERVAFTLWIKSRVGTPFVANNEIWGDVILAAVARVDWRAVAVVYLDWAMSEYWDARNTADARGAS